MDSLLKPFMNSRKVYVSGKMYPDIRVGMREILTEDPETPVVPVYDTSDVPGHPRGNARNFD